MFREFWELFLMGFAYLDLGLSILLTFFLLPLALVGIGIYQVGRRLRHATKHL